MPSIDFKATSDAKLYRAFVGGDEITFVADQGSMNLEAGTHLLSWLMVGDEGESLSLVGTDAQREVVNLKKSLIPEGEQVGGGVRRFQV